MAVLWNRAFVWLATFGTGKLAKSRARIWNDAANDYPGIVEDLLALGGVLGQTEAQNLDPQALAYEAGRRDLALALLSMTGMSRNFLETVVGDFDQLAPRHPSRGDVQ